MAQKAKIAVKKSVKKGGGRFPLVWRVLFIVFLAVFMGTALTVLVFTKIGTEAFASIKLDEYTARLEYVTDVTANYLQRKISDSEYTRALGYYNDIWDASVYGFNALGELFLYPIYTDTQANQAIAIENLPYVMEGNTLAKPEVMVLGRPVMNESGKILGAVILVKPTAEINNALSRIIRALIVSMFVVWAIMLIPIYIASRSISKPINEITVIASRIAAGDLSLTIPVLGGSDEIISLGNSINNLKTELSSKIIDLRSEKNRIKNVLDGMSDGLISLDVEGKITLFNPTCIKLIGDDLYKKNIYKTDCDNVVVEAIIQLINKSGEACGETDVAYEDAIIHIAKTPLLSAESNYSGCVLLLRDITQEYRYEQARRDYVANVSHELRTPLTSIRGFADALNDGLITDEEKKKKFYSSILKESIRLSGLINDLLDLSKLQSGTTAFELRKTDIAEVVNDTVDIFKSGLAVNSERQIKLTVLCEAELPFVYTNENRLSQVITIMLDNAVKHSDTKTIEVIVKKSQSKKNKLTVEVKNEGAIALSDQKRVFERFYKADDKAHAGGGTGLGLSIAYEIMGLLHEDIWVSSENGYVVFGFTVEAMEN